MKINQTKKKDLPPPKHWKAYLKAISQENKIKTKANCMQPTNSEKQQLHKRLHKRFCPIINSSYSATFSVSNYDSHEQKIDWSLQNLLEDKEEKNQHINPKQNNKKISYQ